MLSNMYVMTGGGGRNTLEFEVDDGVMLIDTKDKGWEQKLENTIHLASQQPITRILNTNPSAAATNAYFGKDVVEIYAHENTKARLAQMNDFKGANAKFLPNKTFKDKLTVPLKTVGSGDNTNRMDLYYFGVAYSDGDMVAAFPSFGVAYVGELFPERALPKIDTANGGSMLAFPDTLAKMYASLNGTEIDSLMPSQAPVPDKVVGTWFSMKDLQDYIELNKLFVDTVKTAFAAGKTVDEAVAAFQLPDKLKKYGVQNAKADAEVLYRELKK
jgi:hypothetical protein